MCRLVLGGPGEDVRAIVAPGPGAGGRARAVGWHPPVCGAGRRRMNCLPRAEGVTEGYRVAWPGCWLVERFVDRVPCALGAFCAFCAFSCAVCAAGALRAVRRANGKEKVYGSIP